MDDRVIRSPLLPGGDLIAAVLDRAVMGLADRGGASNLIGSRWADLCAVHAAGWPGQTRPVPGDAGRPLRVTNVVRLDATPAIAAAAARRGLQNPDLLLVGTRDGRRAIQAADAKFSIETARSKQVSPAVVDGLLGIGDLLDEYRAELGADDHPAAELVPGVFLSPDFPLTHLILRRRHGIVRTTVRADEVVFVPAPPRVLFEPVEGASLIPPLAGIDALPVSVDASLLAALYYFRLARAAVGCWLDATKPLLLHNDALVVDETAVRIETERRVPTARSAFDLIARWNADVQTVRAERAAVDQVAALPLMSRELRDLVNRVAAEAGAEPPSVNQVRRRLGAWYRGKLREAVGPLRPPVHDLPRALAEVARASAALAPQLDAEGRRVIRELIERRSSADTVVVSADMDAG